VPPTIATHCVNIIDSESIWLVLAEGALGSPAI
jgi:hypothetical protein